MHEVAVQVEHTARWWYLHKGESQYERNATRMPSLSEAVKGWYNDLFGGPAHAAPRSWHRGLLSPRVRPRHRASVRRFGYRAEDPCACGPREYFDPSEFAWIGEGGGEG